METIAIYARLSKAEHLPTQESQSIDNQIALAKAWIAGQPDIMGCPVKIYVDEGYTGTNLDRPAVKTLLAGVFLGKIQILVVKDLSRLSRSHLMLSELLEMIFPKYSLRVIGIGENYDSFSRESMELALGIQSVFYEYYARDISRKVKSSLAAKKEKGEYAVARVPYGYRKGKDCSLEIVPQEAAVVEQIFELSLKGENCPSIVSKLGGTWEVSQIWRILHNPVYTGQRVWHKYESCYENGFHNMPISRSGWRQEEDAHPAIISRERYCQAQSLHPTTAAYGKKKGKRHIFHGITRCGICQAPLCRHRHIRELLVCLKKHPQGQVSISQDTLWHICFSLLEKNSGFAVDNPVAANLRRLWLQIFLKNISVGGENKIGITLKIKKKM